MELSLESQIEAILFYKGEPVKIKDLCELTGESRERVEEAIENLKAALEERGVSLVKKDEGVLFTSDPRASGILEQMRQKELNKDIGDAGAETLSIILYKGPVSRPEIDYIRGVNSAFILRNLLIRGLVERISNPQNRKSWLYKSSFDLLSYLGITKVEELPDFEKIQSELESFVNEKSQQEYEKESQ